jgi:hypothetical protein
MDDMAHFRFGEHVANTIMNVHRVICVRLLAFNVLTKYEKLIAVFRFIFHSFHASCTIFLFFGASHRLHPEGSPFETSVITY